MKKKKNKLIKKKNRDLIKEHGVLAPLTSVESIKRSIDKKAMLVFRIKADKTFRFDWARPVNNKFFDVGEGHYIYNPKYIIHNKRQSMMMYYDGNPDPINPIHLSSDVNGIFMTANELKKYGLQKIWGDYVNVGMGFDFKKYWWVIVGGLIVVAFFTMT